jgi:hypothetical protein
MYLFATSVYHQVTTKLMKYANEGEMWLTRWSRVSEVPAFCGTRMFSTSSWTRWVQFTTPLAISLRSTITLISHLCLGLRRASLENVWTCWIVYGCVYISHHATGGRLLAFAVSVAVSLSLCGGNACLLVINTKLITYRLLIVFNWYCGHESCRMASETSFCVQHINNSGKWELNQKVLTCWVPVGILGTAFWLFWSHTFISIS